MRPLKYKQKFYQPVYNTKIFDDGKHCTLIFLIQNIFMNKHVLAVPSPKPINPSEILSY